MYGTLSIDVGIFDIHVKKLDAMKSTVLYVPVYVSDPMYRYIGILDIHVKKLDAMKSTVLDVPVPVPLQVCTPLVINTCPNVEREESDSDDVVKERPITMRSHCYGSHLPPPWCGAGYK